VALRAAGAGAADAWLTPILMKKGSPAHTLSVLAGPDQAATLRRLVFTETSTIGLRERRVAQYELVRNVDTMSVDGEQIWVKLAWLDEPLVNTQPEYTMRRPRHEHSTGQSRRSRPRPWLCGAGRPEDPPSTDQSAA
jgi:uncharacterized protein (DUF111 family)